MNPEKSMLWERFRSASAAVKSLSGVLATLPETSPAQREIAYMKAYLTAIIDDTLSKLKELDTTTKA